MCCYILLVFIINFCSACDTKITPELINKQKNTVAHLEKQVQDAEKRITVLRNRKNILLSQKYASPDRWSVFSNYCNACFNCFLPQQTDDKD